MEKTVHSDQVQPVTNIEDDDADMNVDVPRYPSPVAGENVAGVHNQEQLQICQEVFTVLHECLQ